VNLLEIGKPEYRLFDAMRRRFIRLAPRRMDEREAAESNDYFVKSFCPNLQWIRAEEQAARSYTIRR
jgi:hypothetical protein